MSRRSWVYRQNDKGEVEAVELTAPVEWLNGGLRYGSETLEEMRKKNLVPPETFSEQWEKAAAERERVYRLGEGDTRYVKNDEASLQRKREMYQYLQARARRRG